MVVPWLMKVYPHRRGDWRAASSRTVSPSGSPPRAWGLAAGMCPGRCPARFTPTGMGTGLASWRTGHGRTVHPHGRGTGVSTAVGTVQPAVHPHGHRERSSAYRSAAVIAGSPHRCAEQRRRRWIAGASDGSPPRAWGAGPGVSDYAARARFTPTGVGSRRSCDSAAEPPPVHPHRRGEQPQSATLRRGRAGFTPEHGEQPVELDVVRPNDGSPQRLAPHWTQSSCVSCTTFFAEAGARRNLGSLLNFQDPPS